MKKLFMIFALALVGAPCMLAWTYPEYTQELPYESGLGTEEFPYMITSAQQLACLSYHVNSGTTYESQWFALANDIDLNPSTVFASDGSVSSGTPQGWIPIGNDSHPFKGFFDGGGHKVKGLYFDKIYENTGLFGCINCAIMRNVIIDNSGIYLHLTSESMNHSKNDFAIGTLVGRGKNLREISGCVNNAAVTVKVNDITCSGNVTGLVGINLHEVGYDIDCNITGCVNNGNIHTVLESNANKITVNVAGLIGGWSGWDYIAECTNNGNITCEGNNYYNYTGGICTDFGYRTIGRGLRNTGDIYSATGLCGGIFGQCGFRELSDCHNEGNVTGYNEAGGISANAEIENLIDCTNSGDITVTCVPDEPQSPSQAPSTWFPNLAGGLMGHMAYLEEMRGCVNYGHITSNGSAGGICGDVSDYSQDYSIVQDCRNEGVIDAKWGAGGIAASCRSIWIKNCKNTGNVTGGHQYTGGICGQHGTNYYHEKREYFEEGNVNTGSVKGSKMVGGIAGATAGTMLTLSYNTGDITGEKYTGGIAGDLNSSNVVNSYNAGTISSQDIAGGITGSISGGYLRNLFNYGKIDHSNGNTSYGSIVGTFSFEWGNTIDAKNVYYRTSTGYPLGGSAYGVTVEGIESKSSDDFSSGSVCVLLNGDQQPAPWGQQPRTDPYPLLNGGGNPDIGAIDMCVSDASNDVEPVIYDMRGMRIHTPLSGLRGIYIVGGVTTLLNGE